MTNLTVTLTSGHTENVQGSVINIEHGSLVVWNVGTLVKAWAPGTWFSIEVAKEDA